MFYRIIASQESDGWWDAWFEDSPGNAFGGDSMTLAVRRLIDADPARHIDPDSIRPVEVSKPDQYIFTAQRFGAALHEEHESSESPLTPFSGLEDVCRLLLERAADDDLVRLNRLKHPMDLSDAEVAGMAGILRHELERRGFRP